MSGFCGVKTMKKEGFTCLSNLINSEEVHTWYLRLMYVQSLEYDVSGKYFTGWF